MVQNYDDDERIDDVKEHVESGIFLSLSELLLCLPLIFVIVLYILSRLVLIFDSLTFS